MNGKRMDGENENDARGETGRFMIMGAWSSATSMHLMTMNAGRSDDHLTTCTHTITRAHNHALTYKPAAMRLRGGHVSMTR